ncbi:hypothetical protein FSP39_003645 [Pinctada imbricata]|uniref:Peptidase A2 domain-containing protein n=1 Tax=Pinctada imbricata TaxID=66713 RepID=A0AA88YRH9_PINIB|nr:hypothetical protein FSP39_003645 [Pinctada imbricata]
MPKFNPPETFDFSKPSDWPEWKQRFLRYRTASKLHKEDEDIQISSLIYVMGLQAEHVFKSFVYSVDEDQTKYEDVMKKFDSYFVPKRNVIHERAKFHMRTQGQGESVETFIGSLHELAEHCEFDNKSEVIRDRLVIGIRDKEVSEKLQLQADLTLDKACEMARNSELVKSQIKDLQSHNLDAVKTHNRTQGANARFRQGQGRGRGNKPQQRKPASYPVCDRCNRKHPANQCPAFGQQCRKCKNLHHFAICCKTKMKQKACNEIQQQNDDFDDETYFLGSIENNSDTEPWYVNLKVNNRILSFKIDTGADVSVISEATYKHLRPKPNLVPIRSTLSSPGGVLHC